MFTKLAKLERVFYWAAIAVLLFFLLKMGCKSSRPCPCNEVSTTDTTVVKKVVKDSGHSHPEVTTIIPISQDSAGKLIFPPVIFKNKQHKSLLKPNTPEIDSSWWKNSEYEDPHRYDIYIDTTAIIVDYLSQKIFRDSLKTKYGIILVTDTLQMNSIYGRGWKADFNVPETTITKNHYIYPKIRTEVYAGLSTSLIQLNRESKVFVGPSLAVKTKRNDLVNLSYQTNFAGSTIYQVGLYKKISFRKKPITLPTN